MAQYRVLVNLLNKRFHPVMDFTDKSNVAGLIKKDELIEGVEEIILSNGKWIRDQEGFYYWGGGLSPEGSTVDVNKLSWGHRRYNMPFVWNDLKTKGKGVTVAVIDTGIDVNNTDLTGNIHPLSKSFDGDSGSLSDADGHGTGMAGIIGATGQHQVFGVAPEASLMIIKAASQVRGPDLKVFARALQYAADIPAVDIISISYSFPDNDDDFRGAINKCISANKIIVSAIGNGRNFIQAPDGPDEDTYPACYNSVIAVGSFDVNGRLCNFSNWHPRLSFLAPGDFKVLTTGLNNTVTMGSGTGIAAAFTAGSLALLASYAKKNSIPLQKCTQAMLDSCDDYGDHIGKDIQSGYGLMNLRNAVSKLKRG
jgi:subtilisin family serine protease